MKTKAYSVAAIILAAALCVGCGQVTGGNEQQSSQIGSNKGTEVEELTETESEIESENQTETESETESEHVPLTSKVHIDVYGRIVICTIKCRKDNFSKKHSGISKTTV